MTIDQNYCPFSKGYTHVDITYTDLSPTRARTTELWQRTELFDSEIIERIIKRVVWL